MLQALRNHCAATLLVAALVSGVAPLTAKAQVTSLSQTSVVTPAMFADTLARLPVSEAVMYFDVQRLFTDALPRAFVNSTVRLDEISRDIEAFKTRTGIDARAFDVVAVSLKFTPRLKSLFPPQGTLQINPVVIARGRFDANRIFAAGQQAVRSNDAVSSRVAQDKEITYKGVRIYTVKIDENVKILGLINLSEREISIAALDANTLAIGKPQTVRATIDANMGGKRVSAELLQLATRQSGALMGFAGFVPAVVSKRVDLGDKELSRRVAAVRALYGGVTINADSFEMLTTLRTTDASAAQELSQTLKALQSFVPGLISQLPAAIGRAAAAGNARNIRIEPRGNEVSVRIEIAPPGKAAFTNQQSNN